MFKEIDWASKLASRKFWALLVGVVTSSLVLLGAGEDTIVKVAGLIGAVGSAIGYMVAEAHVDGKSAANVTIEYEVDGDDEEVK